jgi:predicted SAM-dependent methyltransferase
MGIKYHLGCGLNYFPGYTNIDYPQSEHTIIAVKADIYSDLMTVKLEPCELIESHHVFEHFSYIESLALLVKWTRVLVIGGVLRIDIPDIEVLCQELGTSITAKDHRRVFKIVRLLYGSHEAEWAFHINGWSMGTLSYTMDRFGFSIVSSERYGSRNAAFPNCGLNMVFNKTREDVDLEAVARDLLSFYTDIPDQQNLLNEFQKQFTILMGKI